jgi:hypothetical protein
MGTRIKMPSKWDKVVVAAAWLGETMPNPPLPEPQRYNIYNSADGSITVDFADEQDAIMFSLSCQL